MEAKYIYTELNENSNKFWHIVMNDSSVTTHWGRVGDNGSTLTKTFLSTIEAERFYTRKISEKERKGYTLQKTFGASPTIVDKGNLAVIAHKQIEHGNCDETRKLIDFLVRRNIHAIEGATGIKFNESTGQLTTPLGVVTIDGINEAEGLLKRMADLIENKQFGSYQFTNLVNQYMRIVPQNIGRRRVSAASLFGSMAVLQRQQQLLDTLRAVVNNGIKASADDAPVVFRTKLVLVDSSDPEFGRIKAKYERSINRGHSSSSLKLKKVWKVEVLGAETAFENDGIKVGNIKELWHGTKDANLLALLKGGYIIPRNGSSIRITGRMFGDGVYFSDQSTKALNYATDVWGGGRSQRCFMLLNDVAMGKEFIPKNSFSAAPKGYDSTFAKAGASGVRNNEMVVYRTSQIRPKYLCEFE